MRSRQGPHADHILIGGTGRAGTTLLVQYFTALGFDTGFTLDQAMQRVDSISRAGLEHSLMPRSHALDDTSRCVSDAPAVRAHYDLSG